MTKEYSIEQAELVTHVRTKVAALFAEKPVPAHGFDHADRVAANCVRIAEVEGYADLYIAELVGLLHDIGRVQHHYDPSKTHLGHHELSYILLQEWFHKDNAFDVLTDDQKKQLLYSVRYHYNNAADDYELAYLLRDADKIDMLGDIGIKRTHEFMNTESEIEMDIRMKYDSFYWVKTDTAKRIIKERKLMETLDEFYMDLLRKQIDPVAL